MMYPNAETYLNEEIRRPIQYLLKDVDKKVVKEVMSYVNFLCDKYRESNLCAKFYEDSGLIDVSKFKSKDYLDYLDKNLKHVNYDELEKIIPDEELAQMVDDSIENQELIEELSNSIEEAVKNN